MYGNDYVSEPDLKPWEVAKQQPAPDSATVAKASVAANGY
jgi:hypothetical protein